MRKRRTSATAASPRPRRLGAERPGDVRCEHDVREVVERRLGRERLGLGGVDERAQATRRTLVGERVGVDDRAAAVFTSHAPSRMSASLRPSTRWCVSGSSGACTLTTSAHANRSSSSIGATPRSAASPAVRYGSATATSTPRVASRSMTRRPTIDAPMMPTRSPTVPMCPAGPRPKTGSVPRTSRNRSRTRNTSLAIITIAANVNSATGTTFADAALDTRTPCSQVAGVTVVFTVPAAYARYRTFGMRTSSSASSRAQPQLPTTTSIPARVASSSVGRSIAVGASTRRASRAPRAAGERT